MFMGEYSHSLDAKGRLIIPAKYREALGNAFVVTKSLDKCLCIYDTESWNAFTARLAALPHNTREQRELVRFFLSGASEVEVDKQGRILLPANLRAAAGIDRDVVLAGVGDKIEIWSKEAWEGNISNEEINRIAEKMMGEGLVI
ncbi:MAG: division/cell wall cluster transcriptional repressor MraZ [Eubacteriales bacterium]|nr:division/cell wall cluster transcriptional repressor MraZ [Eubacteriales bacterium]